jgi:hypothetical protein
VADSHKKHPVELYEGSDVHWWDEGVDGSGRTLVTWKDDEARPPNLMGRWVTPDGGLGATMKIGESSGNSTTLGLAVGPPGRAFVAWERADNTGISESTASAPPSHCEVGPLKVTALRLRLRGQGKLFAGARVNPQGSVWGDRIVLDIDAKLKYRQGGSTHRLSLGSAKATFSGAGNVVFKLPRKANVGPGEHGVLVLRISGRRTDEQGCSSSYVTTKKPSVVIGYR